MASSPVGVAIVLGLIFQLGLPMRALRTGWAVAAQGNADRKLGILGLIVGAIAGLLQLALLAALLLGIPALF
ncbi:MAG TPA: hypothetical protein EYQ25_05470 [Planctomycetes bacterium]|nr:hypothetical protein [Planctomycetota bacterium]HIL36153.1 hypothetical protein [Planctomycetota bacterium]